MERTLLGIFGRKSYIFIEVEASELRAIKLRPIGCLGEVFIEARGRATSGQAEDIGILPL